MTLSKDERLVLELIKKEGEQSPSNIYLHLTLQFGLSNYSDHVALIDTMIKQKFLLKVTNDPIQYAITRHARQELSNFVTQKRKETIGWWMRLILPFTAIGLSIFGLIFNYD